MRDLDAAGNPYAGQYAEFDRWAYDHYVNPSSRRFRKVFATDNPPAINTFFIQVDSQGYVVPMATQLKWMLNPPGKDEQSPCKCSFYCAGDLDPQLQAWLQAATVAQLAQAAPPIPRWLADNPPRWASAVPGGEFVTFGRLGSGTQLDVGLPMGQLYNLMPGEKDDASGGRYCRYSADGELLAEAAPDQQWWRIFFTDFDRVAAEVSHGLDFVAVEYNGTVVIYEKTSWSELAVFDFQGHKLDVKGQKYGAQRLLHWIYGGNLKGIYDWQKSAAANPEMASGAATRG